MPADTGGPYVAAAFFCEKVLIEQDGVASVIRMFDRMTVHAQSTTQNAQAPEALPQMAVGVTLYLLLRAGKARGRHRIDLTIELPSGIRHEHPQKQYVQFEGEERGAQMIADMQLPVIGEGLYWFEIAVEGDFVTKIPLRIHYQPH